MRILKRRARTIIPEGAESPLAAALHGRDRALPETVAEAIRHRETLLAYQPVFQAQRPHGAMFHEGLIRVLDPAGRIIPAREFMPAIEASELGRMLDCNALDAGLKVLARHPALRLSINMSARSIGYKAWMKVLDRNLARDPTLGERLMLEISEASAMTVPELVIDFMDRLQPHGIAFALDDFGGGATVFGHFREFCFDAVKIDAQFARDLARSPDNQAVVQALVAVARQFDMMVIATAVERVEDAEFLVRTGVDGLQGRLFGAPTIRPDWEGEAQRRRA
ncbi:EAL domain-containing protein [Seohaeicola zhoushanensis]|uniref:Diguanylate phosphodiesterase n=1 Tax=Seohaeicola zhoushanensis TaxID=1569283 RepID=A0A8J3GV58_9RHOB|nr:diguanylate phosphodiesterase [Seohaeicola zhoushanensis]